jgi:hypothetical protein
LQLILKTTCLKGQQFNLLPGQTYLIFSIPAISLMYGACPENKGLGIEIEDQDNPPSFSGFNYFSTENKSNRYPQWNSVPFITAAPNNVGVFCYDGRSSMAARFISVKTGGQLSTISSLMMNKYLQNKVNIQKRIIKKYAGGSICPEILAGF